MRIKQKLLGILRKARFSFICLINNLTPCNITVKTSLEAGMVAWEIMDNRTQFIESYVQKAALSL